MPDLHAALERLFPFARKIEITVPFEDDGSFLVELVLPVREGESAVQVYRFPQGCQGPPHEDRLRWRGAQRRSSFGEGGWGFLAAWDGVASIAEIRALVSSRLVRDPELGDPDFG